MNDSELSRELPSNTVTPLILTYNEEPNIDRTLQSLRWAGTVVVLDSGSTDRTEEISRSYRNVQWRTHPFDSFGAQWRHGVHELGISTEYVLALDADMEAPEGLAEEITNRFSGKGFDGGILGFRYRMWGSPLGGSLYPPDLRIFKRTSVSITQIGHKHHFSVPGSVYRFNCKLLHDDRKPLERWIGSQTGYAALEKQRMAEIDRPSLREALRKAGVMPWIAGIYAYIKSGGPLKGKASLEYAYQRTLYECILAMHLFQTEREQRQTNVGKASPELRTRH